MNKPKSLWLTIAAIIACVGCCSVPLYALFAGGTGLTLLLNGAAMEILKCALPLVLFGIGYLLYRKHQAKKRCCPSPQGECSTQKCATQPGSKR